MTEEQKENRRERMRAKRDEWKAQGLCTRCGKRPAAFERCSCNVCLAKATRWYEKRVESRKEAHLCAVCGKPLPDGEISNRCHTCSKKGSQATRAWQLRMRAEHRCISCRAQDERTLAGHPLCDKCQKYNNARTKDVYDMRKNNGRCVDCGVELPSGWKYVRCAACHEQSRTAIHAWAERQRDAQ